MEPEFILDLDREESLEQLASISRIVSEKPKKYNPDARFLRNFTLSLFRVGESMYKKRHQKIHKIEIKQKIEEKKPEIKVEKKPEIKLEAPKPVELPQPKFPEYPLVTTIDGKTLVMARVKDTQYFLDEPILSNQNFSIIEYIKKDIGKKLAKKQELFNDKKYLTDNFSKACKKFDVELNDEEYEKLKYYLIRDLIGYGRIDSLFKDSKIKEIVCDGIRKELTVLYEDKILNTNIIYQDIKDIDDLIKKFIEISRQKLEKNQAHFEAKVNGIEISAILGLGVVSSRFIIKK